MELFLLFTLSMISFEVASLYTKKFLLSGESQYIRLLLPSPASGGA